MSPHAVLERSTSRRHTGESDVLTVSRGRWGVRVPSRSRRLGLRVSLGRRARSVEKSTDTPSTPRSSSRTELTYVREAMLRTRLTDEIPTSSATSTMCAVCPYRDLCADDVWVDDGDGVDTVPTFEHVYIGT